MSNGVPVGTPRDEVAQYVEAPVRSFEHLSGAKLNTALAEFDGFGKSALVEAQNVGRADVFGELFAGKDLKLGIVADAKVKAKPAAKKFVVAPGMNGPTGPTH